MALSNLTEAEIKQLKDCDNIARSAVIEMFKAMRMATTFQQQYNAMVPVGSKLDVADLVPTDSGLNGIAPFGKADMGQLNTWLKETLDFWNSKNPNDTIRMALYVK